MPPIADISGYVAAVLVLMAFVTRDMRSLRIMAILSNIAFIIYGALDHLAPVLCLHLVLLPINVVRLIELHQARCQPATAIKAPLPLTRASGSLAN